MPKEKLTHFPAFRETYLNILELPGQIRLVLCTVLEWDDKTFDEKITTCLLSEKELAMVILAYSHLAIKALGRAENPASNTSPN